MARPKAPQRDPVLKYAGDATFEAQIKKIEIAETVEGVKKRIHETVQGDAVVSPTQLLTAIVGDKMQEEEPEDPVTVQAFALNFLSLWNEEVAKREPGEATDKWRASLQTLIEEEAREAQKPYVAKERPGRNDPCSCGSGKKYKKCHGA